MLLLRRRAELHAGVLRPLPLDLERKHAMEFLFHRDTITNPSATANRKRNW